MAPKTNFAWALALLSVFSSTVSAQIPLYEPLRMGHAIMGPVAFIIILPAGAILMKAGKFKGVVWAHAAVQMLAYLMLCYVFAVGVWMAYENVPYYPTSNYYYDPHILTGIIIFCLMTFQPFIGTFHHLMFKRYERRTFVSFVHILLGRTIILLGMINGGLGLQLGGDATGAEEKAYGIVAAIVYFIYLLTTAYLDSRNAKEQKWMVETDGALAKREMGIESKKYGVYEDRESE